MIGTFFFKGLSHIVQDDLKTLSVAETGPELLFLLPQPPEFWNYRYIHPHPAQARLCTAY